MTTLPINESQTCKPNIYKYIFCYSHYLLLNIIIMTWPHIFTFVCHVGRHIFIVTQSTNDNFHSIISALLDNVEWMKEGRKKNSKTIKKVRVQLQYYAKPFLLLVSFTNINIYISLLCYIILYLIMFVHSFQANSFIPISRKFEVFFIIRIFGLSITKNHHHM